MAKEASNSIAKMTDSGQEDRFELWCSGFEENVKHEPSAASRSKKVAQLHELEWRKKVERKNLSSIDCDSSSEAAAVVKGELNNAETEDGQISKLEDLFRKPPVASWPKSVTSGDHLLVLMVEEMAAITNNVLQDPQVIENETLLKQLEGARMSVLKYVTGNHRAHLTKTVMRCFQVLTNVQINKIGGENQQRCAKKASADLILKRKVSDMMENAQLNSLPTFKSSAEIVEELLKLDDVEKKTLTLLGNGWNQYYSKLEQMSADKIFRCLPKLQSLQDKLKNSFYNRDLPMFGTEKLKEVYEKMLNPVLDELKSSLQLEGLVPSLQQMVAKWYQPVHDRVVAEEEVVSKAKKWACAKYLEFMLEKFPTGKHLQPEEVTTVHSEVRERIEVAFFTVPDFLYGLLWTFDVQDEDLIEQFKKERLNRIIAAGAAVEDKLRCSDVADNIESQSTAAKRNFFGASSKANVKSKKYPKLAITVSTLSKNVELERTVTATSSNATKSSTYTMAPDSTEPDDFIFPPSSSSTPPQHQSSEYTPKRRLDRVSESPASEHISERSHEPTPRRRLQRASESTARSPNTTVRVAMYFCKHALRIMYEVDGLSKYSLFPLTVSTIPGPDGELILADSQTHMKEYDISEYTRDRNLMRPLGFKGIYSEVVLAAFIRKCMHHIHKTTPANLYDAFVAVSLPTTVLSACRYRVNTALKLAGFRGSTIVQASTALAMTYAAQTGIAPRPYEVLTIFVDENDIEVTLVEVAGYEFTALDVKIISLGKDHILEPQNVVDAVYDCSHLSNIVFCMSHADDFDPHPFGQALRRSFGRVVCRPLKIGLLPGLLSISSGRAHYKERFPWEIAIGCNRINLTAQNVLQPEQNPRLIFGLHEIEGNSVTVYRRDAISNTEEEEVSLQEVQKLYKMYPEGQVAVEVTNENLLKLEFRSNNAHLARNVIRHLKHMAVNPHTMRIAREQVDKMAVNFPNRPTSSRSSIDDDRRQRSLSRPSSTRTVSQPGDRKRRKT